MKSLLADIAVPDIPGFYCIEMVQGCALPGFSPSR